MNQANEIQKIVDRYFLLCRIIWLALFVASLAYAFVCWQVLSHRTADPVDSPDGTFTLIITVVAFVVGFMSQVFKVLVYRGKLDESPNHLKTLPQSVIEALPQAPLKLKAFILAYPKWLVAHIVAFALSESVVIFGLVLGFVSNDFSRFIPFWIGGVALLAWHFPRSIEQSLGSIYQRLLKGV